MSDQYGFYSQQHADRFGASVYSTPSGTEVYVTYVSEDIDAKEYVWPDKMFVGPVTKCVRPSPGDGYRVHTIPRARWSNPNALKALLAGMDFSVDKIDPDE